MVSHRYRIRFFLCEPGRMRGTGSEKKWGEGLRGKVGVSSVSVQSR